MATFTRRQAWVGLTLGIFVLVVAAKAAIDPLQYAQGDFRSGVAFAVLTVTLLAAAGLWVLIPSVRRLRRP